LHHVDAVYLRLAGRSRDHAADAWHLSAQLAVGLILEGQAAVEAAADAGNLLRVERQILFLCHLDGDRRKRRLPRGATEALTAHVIAIKELGAVAFAHLQHLDACAELIREVTYKVSEVDPLRRREVERDLTAVEIVF